MGIQIKRGDLYYANLDPIVGSEQGGKRPVLVIQNNVGNKYCPTVVVAAVTGQETKAKSPTHISISSVFLSKPSIVLLEQIRTIDKRRLEKYVGHLDAQTMEQIDKALHISVGLTKKGAC